MNRWIVCALALACSGCATVAKVDLPDAAKSNVLPVSDMRPVGEKDRKIFSLFITSEKYGIIRAGDGNIDPSPVRLLQYRAFQKFGAADHKITIDHFVIYENMKSQLRSGATGAAIGGIIGAEIANAMSGHGPASQQTQVIAESTFDNLDDQNEYQRGFYTASENPDKGSVFVIYIGTNVDGKRVLTRTIASMDKHGSENPLAAAVELAIKNHLDDYGSTTATVASTQSAGKAVPDVSPQPGPAVAAPVQAAVVPAPAGSGASKAQDLANQLGCGAVQDNGNSTYIAPCGSYGVYIDCDGDACRPLHTVKMKGGD